MTTETTTSDTAGTPRGPVLTTRTTASTDAVRTEVETGGSEETPISGLYVLTNTATGVMTTIMPQQRMAMVGVTAGGMGGLGRLLKVSVVGEPQVTTEDLGAGEPILGYATRRYRTTARVVMAFSVGSESCRRTTSSTSEVWLTTAAGAPAAIQDNLQQPFGSFGRETPMGVALAKVQDARSKWPKGILLRAVQTSQQVTGAGGLMAVRTRTEVTALAKSQVSPSTFAIPFGYTLVDGAAATDGLDPARMESMAKTGMRSQCDPAPKKD